MNCSSARPNVGTPGVALLAAGVLTCGCALAGCGGGSKWVHTTNETATSRSAAPRRAIAAYRKTLEQAIAIASADEFDFYNCTDGFSTQRCRQWANTDQAQARQILKLLAGAPVPTSDADGSRALIKFMHRVIALDVALRNAVSTGNGRSGAVLTVETKIGNEPTEVDPILNKLDPGLAYPLRGQ
jgi:hypothetical protein